MMHAMRFLVIQHIPCEPPAAYEDEMRARGITLDRVEIDAGDRLPDWRTFDAIVAMGGPMGVYEDERLPWLEEEKQLIADAVSAQMPYWGVCLGAQLLAASLGARVYSGERPEVGIYRDVSLTEDARLDPVFADAPSPLTALQWHADTFELPSGARLLASSPLYPHQAFVWRRAYGLQFHLEVSAALAASWGEVPAYAQALTQTLGPSGLDRLVADLERIDPTDALARQLFGRWIDAVVLGGGYGALL
jgi:GMP synthase (glutamine-hydrolysing)